jgi:adenosylcobyric acid synthase
LVTATALGEPVHGYRIHHGRVHAHGGDEFVADCSDAGAGDDGGTVDGVQRANFYGTTLHGLFEADGFRRAFLALVATRAGKRFVPGTRSFAAVREQRIDRLADLFEAHVELDAVFDLVASAAPVGTGGRS